MYEYLSYGNEWAQWAYDNDDRTKVRNIRVEIVTERDRQYSVPIRNIITRADSTVLSTRYPYPFEIGQHVLYRGTWYCITNIGERSLDINPQALVHLRPTVNMIKLLELGEVR